MVVSPVRPAQAATNPEIVRLAGPNRYATAVEVSQHHHPGGTATVVVASGANFPDAVAGAALAGDLGVPLLLTQPGSLPAVTHDEILRLDPDAILLLGGPAAVSSTVFDDLAAIAPTTRIAGANRYETAIEISKHAFGNGEPPVVVIATGADFPDALAGAPLATVLGGPVLLTRPGDLPQSVRNEIIRLDPAEILVLGGTTAVSSAVFDELTDLAPATRIAGADRYATAVEISQHLFAVAAAVYVAVGTNFPDALAGAAAAAAAGAPVLLTQTNDLPTTVRDEEVRLSPDTVFVLGGLAVIGLVPEHRLANPTLPTLGEVSVGLVEFVGGLDRPLFVTSRPGDARVFVVGQGGVIWSTDANGESLTVVLDIADEVVCCGERGLLGIAFDPADPSRLFVHYSAEPDGSTMLEEYAFPIASVTANPNPVATILTHPQFASNHNGGMVTFGPDGFLYLALGDGGGAGDPGDNGQDPSTGYGSILRIDVSESPYGIPPGNPFADGVGGAPEVWVYGLRNPWRISFDGDDLYVADVGQGAREEVTLIDVDSGGANLGWSVMEGTLCFDGPVALCTDNDFVDPIHEYFNAGSRCSITGGYVYRGSQFPDLVGTYFFGDFCSGEIMALRAYQGALVDSRVFPVSAPQLSSFGLDGAGRLYATSFSDGTVYLVTQTA
jgi:putative cell wall-binding protein